MKSIKSKKSFLRATVVLLLAVLCTTAFSQNTKSQWTTIIDKSPSSMKSQLVSSSEESIKVHIMVPGFYTTTVTTPNGEANIISVPNSVSTAKAGEPNVPMIGVPVMIGDKARMNVRITDAKYMDFENIEVAPSKGEFPRTVDPATVPYTYGKCYSENAFFPANSAELYAPYILRDYRGQNIAVHPFVYNPITKTLRVYYDLTVEMYKVDDNGQNTINSRSSKVVKMDQDYKNVYQRHFLNYEAGVAKYTPVDEEGDLLIICYDSFISAMTDFVNWKKTRGVNTTIVGTSTAGSTYTAIQNYIRSQYNANNNLTHVLLVGDVAQIPGYPFSDGGSNWSGKGDNQYGQIVGNDIYNDVFIGRFSAQNTTQVTNQVQKVINYERNLTTSATWLQKGLGISASAGNSGHYSEDDYQHVENLRTDLLNYGYTTVYQDYASVSGYPSSSTTTISNHINSGVGIINYCNHGEQTGWQSHYYMNSHVNALTNNNMLPFIFSVACLVGQYDYSSGDCFAETWMHATNGSNLTGAIGGMFSYISQPWVPPMWAQDEFVDILVGSYSSNVKHTLGGTAINGAMSIFDHYSTTSQEAVGTYKAWVLYGDPSMMLRTKTPQAMAVTHDGIIIPGASSYNVTVSNGNGALATITDANHNILGKATVTNGTANISLSGTLTVGSDLTLCVFGYNKETRIETIQVITPEGPYISLDSYTPNVALVGEDTGLSLTFKNVGVEATTGTTTVTLTSNDANVSIITGTKTFSALASDNTVTVNGFQFRLNQGVTLGSNVLLHYKAENGSNIWEGDFAITPNQIFTVNVAANNDSFGTVSGGGQFDYNTPSTVTATPADGYMFTNWTLNGNVVSTDSEYTFNVSNDADLVANFSLGVIIGSGTTTNQYLPCYSYYRYSLSEQIYTPAELGSAGLITSIAFYNGGSTQTRNLDFYMKTTTKSSFTGTNDWIAVTAADKVFSGNVTMTSNDWTTITFTTPFLYDGTFNVVLAVNDHTGTYSTSNNIACRVFSTTGNQALYAYTDNSSYNPTSPSSYSGTKLSVKNQLIVTKVAVDESYSIAVSADPANGGTVTGGGVFNFGDICTVTATPNTGYYFSGWKEYGQVVSKDLTYSFSVFENRSLVATFKEGCIVGEGSTETNMYLPTYSFRKYSLTEQIYTPEEIGATGTITGIGFYNGGAKKSRTLDMYLVLTDKSEFSGKTDWIAATAGDKVFSGEVTMVDDDWTFITFDKPFVYDGTSNLVVIIDDNTGASSAQPHMECRVYSTTSNQAHYACSSQTNYDPATPPSGQNTYNTVVKVKNQLFFNITPPAMLELANNGTANVAAISEAAATGSLYNVTLTGRTLWKDDSWNTLCLPFSMTAQQVTAQLAPTALKELDVTGKYNNSGKLDANGTNQTKLDDNGTLHLYFKDATAISAGVPYLIKWDNDKDYANPVFCGVTINGAAPTPVTFTGGQFVGNYDAITIPGEDKSILFVGADNTLYWPSTGMTIGAFRSYFQLNATTPVRSFRVNFGDNRGEATGVISMENGQWRMDNEAGEWYSVNGVKLNGKPKRKGLYIHNGVKVTIK